jgi:O-antigen/teichoic acid export membrane protein
MVSESPKDAIIRRHVLRSTVGNYVGKFIALAAGFILTPFILHHVGATSYGLLALVGSVTAYGSLLDFGISGAVIKYVAEHRARGEAELAQELVATTLAVSSILGLITVAVGAALAPVFPDLFNVPPNQRGTASWLVLLMGFGIGTWLLSAPSRAVLRGLQRFDLVNVLGAVTTLLTAMSTVVVLLLGGGIIGMVALDIPVTLLMQVPTIWFINRIAPELRFGWRGTSRPLIRKVISYSSLLFVIQVGGRLQTETDEIVIGANLPVRAVTPYAVALKLSEVAQVLTNQFLQVLLPLSSELHAGNDLVRLRSLYITSTRLTLAILLPIACTIVILARSILMAWVGASYASYAYLVFILTLASVIVTSQWPAGSILQGMGRHRLLALTSLGSGLVNLLLSIALVRKFGLTGVALGTLIPTTAEAIGFVLPYGMWVIGVSGTQVLRESYLPALMPAIPMVIVLYSLERLVVLSSLLSIAVVAAIGLLVYVIGYLSVGASRTERQAYRSIALSTVRMAKTRLK